MRRSRARGAALLVPALLLLGGCGTTVQEAFGIGKQAPDEFQVVRRQPLIVPPGSTLRPPQPGALGPQEASSAAQARAVLLGDRAATIPPGASTGEAALLAGAGGPADPEIRRRLLEEDSELTSIDDSRFLVILDWQRRRMTPQGTPIDAAAEAERLRAQGVRVTGPVTVRTGSTPLPQPGS